MKVQLRIFPLNIWASPDKLVYQIQTQVFEEGKLIEPHRWNKTLRRKTAKSGKEVFERWKKKLEEEGIDFWVQ